MKKLVTILFTAALFVGCTTSYDVTLNNGMQFTEVSKPKLDEDKRVYVFKNPSGRSYSISESRIRTIEPHSSKKAEFSNRSGGNEFKSSGR